MKTVESFEHSLQSFKKSYFDMYMYLKGIFSVSNCLDAFIKSSGDTS